MGDRLLQRGLCINFKVVTTKAKTGGLQKRDSFHVAEVFEVSQRAGLLRERERERERESTTSSSPSSQGLVAVKQALYCGEEREVMLFQLKGCVHHVCAIWGDEERTLYYTCYSERNP